jgi:hypothetical protein
MTTVLQEPPLTVPFVDQNTGLVDPIWQLWLINVFGGQNATATSATSATNAAVAAQNSANSAAAAAAAAQATANAAATNGSVAAAVTAGVAVETTRAEAAEALLAPINNPTFTGTVTEPVAVLTAATPTVAAGQLGLGSTTAATASAGAGTLPAAPVNFLVVNVAGTVGKIPLYAA